MANLEARGLQLLLPRGELSLARSCQREVRQVGRRLGRLLRPMTRAERDLSVFVKAEDHHQPRSTVPIVTAVSGEQRQSERFGEQLVRALRVVHWDCNVIEAQCWSVHGGRLRKCPWG